MLESGNENFSDIDEKNLDEKKTCRKMTESPKSDLEGSTGSTDTALEKIEFGKYILILGEDAETDKELRSLLWYLKNEGTHFQISKQLICFLTMLALVLLNLAKPTKSRPSPINIELCGAGFWSMYAAFLVFCALMTIIAIYIVKKEQNLKIKYGRVGMADSDIELSKKNLLALLCLGFFGGAIAGALGMGGGVIYNPILLTLGMPPTVTGASSLFIIFYSKIASTVVY